MEAIIFDVDGTLWDSTDEVAVSWNEALKRETELRRKVTAEELKKEFGKPLEEIMADLFPELAKEEQIKLSQILFRYQNKWMETAPCKVYAGVPEVIRELAKRYKVCIVSNCQEGYIEAFLTYHKLKQYFCDYENHGRTGLSKGENIRLVMERNQVNRAIYVGDTQGDRDAAVSAGVPFIHAAYGFGKVAQDVPRLQRITELPRLLEMNA